MKAVVLSDSHRNFSSIQDILEQEKDAQLIIHAGDVQSDVDDILEAYPRTACAYVRGNNDFAVLNVPYDRFFSLGDTKIFLTHGHRYGVKQDLFRLFARARELGADICIFGHTHTAYCQQTDGIWMLNPGSTWRSYAVIQMENGTVNIEIKQRP